MIKPLIGMRSTVPIENYDKEFQKTVKLAKRCKMIGLDLNYRFMMRLAITYLHLAINDELKPNENRF